MIWPCYYPCWQEPLGRRGRCCATSWEEAICCCRGAVLLSFSIKADTVCHPIPDGFNAFIGLHVSNEQRQAELFRQVSSMAHSKSTSKTGTSPNTRESVFNYYQNCNERLFMWDVGIEPPKIGIISYDAVSPSHCKLDWVIWGKNDKMT